MEARAPDSRGIGCWQYFGVLKMTQVTFAFSENNATIHSKLNLAVQGFRFLRRSTFLGLSDAVFYNFDPRASAFSARMVGPGGGGGGASTVSDSNDASAGSGGGAGGSYEFFSIDDILTKETFTILAPKGGAGAAPGGMGSSASSGSSINVPGPLGGQITIATAGPGNGGIPMISGASPLFNLGGAGGLVFNSFATTQDIYMPGEAGGAGMCFGLARAISGGGGSSIFRGSADQLVVTGPGNSASGFGSGGGGGLVRGTGPAQPGGNGGDGCIIIDEFY